MPRRRRNKKWIYTVVVVILLIVAGVVVYLVWDGYFRDKSSEGGGSQNDTSSAIIDDKKGDEAKKQDDTAKANENEDVVKRKAIQYEGESPNTQEVLTGVVNYAGVNGGKLMIRLSIYQYLSGGSCELVVTQGGATMYNQTVEIISDATTSSCKGFDVPVASLNGGDLQFVVYLKAGEKTGEIRGETSI